MTNPGKLYILVRGDLSPGQQLAQTAHAVAEAAWQHPQLFARWRADPNVVVVDAGSEDDLRALVDGLFTASTVGAVAYALVHEPDLGGELTAVAAFGPGAKRVTARLRLAGGPMVSA